MLRLKLTEKARALSFGPDALSGIEALAAPNFHDKPKKELTANGRDGIKYKLYRLYQ
ncbi:hypothetical protein GSbR_25820 [Geobacter sp. SVR]|nr:hypothetical protein GSVR_24680 [Geobacter sp. SVR]GCF85982.1 hypothetical protein GSbR_25820 [Geobacter sp. SVR]